MSGDLLSFPEAILLGIVEGITEFLPISSTGHLLVVSDLIGFGQGDAANAADTYAIAIQFGAILAVVALYRFGLARLWRVLRLNVVEACCYTIRRAGGQYWLDHHW
jgi:undecaprenyl-diphosphatase